MRMLYEREGYALIGVAMEVYNQMGPGFLEEVYQECMELELEDRQFPIESQEMMGLWFKGKKLKKRYKPDIYVFDCLIVELKAKKTLTVQDEAQLLNYLKGSGKKVGYLFNFGHEGQLQWKRMVLNA